MTDSTTTPPADPTSPVPAADANGQLIVALAIVITLGVGVITLTVAAAWTGHWSEATGLIGGGMGALASSLTAPTGVGNVIRAAVSSPKAP